MLNVVLRSTVVLCMILLLIEQTQGFRTFPTSRLVGNNMGVIGRRQVLQMSTEGGVAATSPKHALFLGNLSFDVDESKLTNVVQERLSNTPGFTNVKLVKDKETGKSRGFAYVNFESEEGLPSALQALQDLEIDGTRCKVDIAGTRDRRQPMTKRNENGEGRGSRGNSFGRAIEDPEAKAKRELEARERTLYVGNLGQDMTDGLLKDIISMQLGDDMQCLKRIKVLMDKETGRSRGFGYLELQSLDDVPVVLNKLQRLDFNGRNLRVDRAQLSSDATSSSSSGPGGRERRTFDKRGPNTTSVRPANSLYLGNLDFEVSEELIEEMLTDILGAEKFTGVRVIRDKVSSRSRGFAYVDFHNEDDLNRAIDELSGIELLGRVIRVNNANAKMAPASGGEY